MMETTERKPVKKVKGMTLVEIIIAMTVFAVAGTMMVKVGAASKSQLKNSNHLINKTQAEVAVGSSDRAITKLRDDYGGNGETVVEFSSPFGTVSGWRYDTLNADEYSGKDCDTGLADNESLQFYKINTTP